ncbi:M56 family metallopeptidase [Pedobacter sp. UBA5917]|jgi:lipopolysaccharide export system protein LptA|uniref:M56 family metallopeptidase n=1 Tax=Pedobacter sp. UBA5917 TaxID=1947061 RepID=UPI0025E62574|nr:M56 family metallopeptidase [Pedobacter sp. UBA5917]
MESLIYLLKVTACTVLFFGFYLLFLRKLTFFKINRFYLLVTLLLSFIIPTLQLELRREIAVVEEVAAEIPEIKPVSPAPVQFIQPVMVKDDQQVVHRIDWSALASYIYVGIALLLLLISLWRVLGLLKHTRGYTKNSDGLKLIPKTEGFTNCSFFYYVFIDGAALSATDLSVLLKHEQVHARQLHSIDKIILMVFKSILWFNPIVYLYDKALEQVHEYEADEITSGDFGNQAYANLLLKLAISKSDMPLVHNFVKSPIKARIKMLFDSKSKNMKKLMYLLALPVALGLFWLFAIQVVYAQQIKEGKKPAKDFYEGTLKGKVLKIEKTTMGGYTINLLSNGEIYPIYAADFKDKIKIGDELVTYISSKVLGMKTMDKKGKVIAELHGPVYIPNKITNSDGTLIFEEKIENYPFLYEANKARSALTRIKAIEKSGNNKIEKIVLNNGTYTINLDLRGQHITDKNFKVGDRVLAKFIGEKLVSKNTYTTDKMIVLYSQPKKYLIKNAALYNRFYLIDGKQKMVAVKDEPVVLSEAASPKIISFSKITGDVRNKTTYMNDAVMDFLNYKLEAKNIEFDQVNNRVIAKDGILKSLDGRSITTASSFDLDLNKGVFKMGHGKGELWADNLTNADHKKEDLSNAKDKVEYKALDSVRFSKDKSIVYLFGNAELRYNKLVVNGRKITYNKNNNTVLVNDATMISDDNKEVKKEVLYFNLKTAETH